MYAMQLKKSVMLCVSGALLLLGALLRLQTPLSRGLYPAANSVDVTSALHLTDVQNTQFINWTDTDGDAQQLLRDAVPRTEAWVVVGSGPVKPTRRSNDQPFLTVRGALATKMVLPVDVINKAAQALETALARPLFPLTLDTADFAQHWQQPPGTKRPFAVWEVGSGTILLDSSLANSVWGAQPEVSYMTGSMFEKLVQHLVPAVHETAGVMAGQAGAAQALSVLGPALAAAVSAAFAAAPPLWFCVACPAVLGLVAPLLINIGLNQLAGVLCTKMSLSDDQCFDVLLGALGVSFVLALASAIPIFQVCKLAECVHRADPPGGAATESVRQGSAAGRGVLRAAQQLRGWLVSSRVQ